MHLLNIPYLHIVITLLPQYRKVWHSIWRVLCLLVSGLNDLWVRRWRRCLCSVRLIILVRKKLIKCEIISVCYFILHVSRLYYRLCLLKQMAQRKIPSWIAFPLGWSSHQGLWSSFLNSCQAFPNDFHSEILHLLHQSLKETCCYREHNSEAWVLCKMGLGPWRPASVLYTPVILS